MDIAVYIQKWVYVIKLLSVPSVQFISTSFWIFYRNTMWQLQWRWKTFLKSCHIITHNISQDILVLLIFKISTEEGEKKQIIPS